MGQMGVAILLTDILAMACVPAFSRESIVWFLLFQNFWLEALEKVEKAGKIVK